MIRINLLAPERKSSKKKAASTPSAPGAFQAYLIFGLFLVGAGALCGLGWWWKTMVLNDLAQKTTAAEAKKKSLEAIEKQVQEFKAKKAELENKKAVLEKLKADQRAPVHMLDEISKALPDFVWLTKLTESGGAITLNGQAVSLSAVADFMTALQRSGYFPAMELVSSQESKEGGVTFGLTGRFRTPEVAAKEKELAEKTPVPEKRPASKRRK
jgi:type IV pilus assembly protein PilN